MKTEWDYSKLAKSYSLRPQYSPTVISTIFKIVASAHKPVACDVGAGTGHLTLHLAKYCDKIIAVEPNTKMLEIGKDRTAEMADISWKQATAENTTLPNGCCDLVTFGSSFNVCDRSAALAEASRLTVDQGWFSCMWNHRKLEDAVQQRIESIIKGHITEYDYGARREDQTEILHDVGLFSEIIQIQSRVDHKVRVDDFIGAWNSHATLERQAGSKFIDIVREIEKYLRSLKSSHITVPYNTRAWIARFK